MPLDSTTEPESDDLDSFVEVDPSRRYGRYKEVLGKGAFKKVYRAFDELDGIEVAWNQVKVTDFCRNSEDLERFYSEVHLLKNLDHKNIIKLYSYWVDIENHHLNFVTEVFTSGTLRQYRQKHKHVDVRVLKKWSRQILEGLLYLHSHDPPVIHRDLKCDNIFVNGNQGEVKIGDLGLATILQQARSAHSVIGTPEFMAPELYEEDYNELVDIYSFGMSLLELVTFEYPYVECANAAQIYKKVTSGIKPASLAKVKDIEVKEFIEKCIAKVPGRFPAKELLVDPFLQSDDNEIINRPLLSNPHAADLKEPVPEGSRDFTVQGQRKDLNTIFLKLRIEDSTGHIRNIHFPFDIEDDTAVAVASEMVQELDLTDQDVSTIASMMDTEIRSHVPDWAPTKWSENNGKFELVSTSGEFATSSQSFALDQLPSGRKYWSDSPKTTGGNTPFRLGPSNLTSEDSSPLVDILKYANGVFVQRHSNDTSSVGSGPEELVVNDNVREREVDHDSADVWVLANELESLLFQQQKELAEIKKKHEVSISEFLKEIPMETREKVCSICKLKILDNESCCQIHRPERNSTDKNSFSQLSLKYCPTGGEGGKQELVAGKLIFGSIFRGRRNEVNRKTKSGVGIAAIL